MEDLSDPIANNGVWLWSRYARSTLGATNRRPLSKWGSNHKFPRKNYSGVNSMGIRQPEFRFELFLVPESPESMISYSIKM